MSFGKISKVVNFKNKVSGKLIPKPVKNALLLFSTGLFGYSAYKKCDTFDTNINQKYELINDNSVINNDLYKGCPYKVEQKGNWLTATNKSTGKVSKLNIYDLTKNLPLKQKVYIKTAIQKLPGEVIEDLVSENIKELKCAGFFSNTYLKLEDIITENKHGTQAFYNPFTDDIVIASRNVHITEIIHELGHAIDWNGKFFNTQSTDGTEFEKMYKKELENFKKSGFKQYDPKRISFAVNNPNQIYATYNEKEMFAECYLFLMCGENRFNKDLRKYFPNTIKTAAQHLQKVRSLPDKNRHI